MKVTVIVPTFNGADKIGLLLAALQNQEYKEFDIVVAIDGSTDNTESVIAHHSKSLRITALRQANKGRAAIRNLGARHASGELLIFYDDDMTPDNFSVNKHVAFHLRNQGLLSGNLIEEIEPTKNDLQNYKAFISKGWIRKYGEGITEMTRSNLFFSAANCSMRKEIFQLLGGFDERLTDNEDYDLAFRALSSGSAVFFDKSNVAMHHDPITCRTYIARQRQYYHSHIRWSSFHGEKSHTYVSISKWKKMIYKCLTLSIFPWIIDNFNVFILLPKFIRYPFYSAVIFAHTRREELK
jgi:glycosyltransferase involved in cell wall biosynthesis